MDEAQPQSVPSSNKSSTITIKKRTLVLLIVIVGVFVIGLYLGGAFSGFAIGGNKGNQGNTVSLNIPSYVPFLGSDSAKLNFVEFGDYQCPFCERFFTQAEQQIIQDYVNTGKIKFYFLDFAFLGPDSTTLGEGAWCANEQGKYYEYHNYVYSHQGPENSGWGTSDKVKTLAANITGIDTKAFNSCLDSGKYRSRVQELTQLGQTSGVTGTPTAFIGNSKIGYKVVVGAYPYSTFKQIIDQMLANN